ncbi:hypothetical protein [Domibacillus enclensis]|uniref:Uncharacterized protein n=1 Tax=Domibacillus enclensis TaxID=1017273 RepID=A0A1N6WEU3_9BACI|nr:hypothetical protein [Domibacillus enclensis]OXS77920.1 hypothetical protein B1B05_09950 [Domibacillus enclensis]SIQ88604.1 hypothetical protein SAMN05443094_104145 [Domibacillus enclensis]
MQINLTLTDDQVAAMQLVIKNSIQEAVQEIQESQRHPEILTKQEAKEILRIKSDFKMDELLNRPDFPVMRTVEKGKPYFIYEELMAWVRTQSTWAKDHNRSFRNAI